jgi:D-glycero-D-manno-heptose 1,7-bisphosphate phosphatase
LIEGRRGRPAVFLDRDGTLMRDTGPLAAFHPELLYPGVADALLELTARGLPVALVTNQGWVARGALTYREAEQATAGLAGYLERAGVRVLGWAFCPHHPNVDTGPYAGRCACRKPEPGLLVRLAMRHGIDLWRSVMVGDNLIDVEAGRRAGTQSVIVMTGDGSRHRGHIPEGVPVLESVCDLPRLVGRGFWASDYG